MSFCVDLEAILTPKSRFVDFQKKKLTMLEIVRVLFLALKFQYLSALLTREGGW